MSHYASGSFEWAPAVALPVHAAPALLPPAPAFQFQFALDESKAPRTQHVAVQSVIVIGPGLPLLDTAVECDALVLPSRTVCKVLRLRTMIADTQLAILPPSHPRDFIALTSDVCVHLMDGEPTLGIRRLRLQGVCLWC